MSKEKKMLERELWDAITEGDVLKTRLILNDQNLNVNWTEEQYQRTCFYRACGLGKIEIVKLFLDDERVNVNQVQSEGVTPFYIACWYGQVETVKLLLEYPQVDVQQKDDEEIAPFYIACQQGYFDIVKLLLNDHRVDVNDVRNDQATPLFIACEKGKLEIVKLLLNDKRVDVNKGRNDQATPLFMACQNGHYNCVLWILATRKEINTKIRWNGRKRTPLEQAIIFSTLEQQNDERSLEIALKRQQNCSKIVEILKEYENNEEQTRFKIRKELKILDAIASEIFSLVVLVTDEYLRVYERCDSSRKRTRLE